MAHLDRGLIVHGHAVLAAGDMPAVVDFLDPGITWHVPGSGPVSGTYRGHDEVLGLLAGCLQRSGGALRVALEGISCGGEHVHVHWTVTAEPTGRRCPTPEHDEHDVPRSQG